MAGGDFVVPTEEGCILKVDVTTRAKKTEIVGINKWRGTMQVRLAALPVKGEANAELVKFLSEKLSVPRDSIAIISGTASTHKQVRLLIDAKRVTNRIEGLL